METSRELRKCKVCDGSGIAAKISIAPEPPDTKCFLCKGAGSLWVVTLKDKKENDES